MTVVRDLAPYRAGLADLINRQLVTVPPGWPLPAEAVATVSAGGPPTWAFRFAAARGLAGRAIAAVSEDRLQAALVYHVSDGLPERDAGHVAVVDWMAAAPDDAGALAAVLDALREDARREHCRRIYGPVRNGLGIGWFGIPGVWAHLVNGLVAAGYGLDEEWLILTGSTTPTGPAETPAKPGDAELRLEAKPDRLEWSLRATLGGRVAGEALVWGIPPLFAACPGASEWAMLEWIGVEEAFRARGLASRLLREQCRLQRKHGVKHLLTCARKGNTAVRRLFASLGFVEGPSLFCFSRPG